MNTSGFNRRCGVLAAVSAVLAIAGCASHAPAPVVERGAPASRAAPAASKDFYTVKKGDTLASLAKRFNVSAKFLAAWNNLKAKVALRPGRRIIVAKYVEKKRGRLAPVADGNG